MDTLIAGALIGFIISLITTWITAKVNKSTDTRTQLLIRIDDWVNKLTLYCTSAYSKFTSHNIRYKRAYGEFVEGLDQYDSVRCIGIAKGLHCDNLISQLENFRKQMYSYANSFRDLIDALDDNPNNLNTLRDT
jgi:hypothetical protein